MNLGGLGPLVVNIIVNYCCARVLLYAKMLKETETEETRLFCHIVIIGGISIRGGGAGPIGLPGYAFDTERIISRVLSKIFLFLANSE